MSRLSGRVVATTRDGDPDDPLTSKLEAEGATVLEWPTLAFDPPTDVKAVERAVASLKEGAFDWVACTSARSVEPLGDGRKLPAGVRVAAVGAATARALRAAGWRVDVIGHGDAQTLVEAIVEAEEADTSRGVRVLFPAASRAGDTLEKGLSGHGARVHRVEVYRTRLAPPDGGRVRADLRRGVSAIAFASPSAVTSLSEAMGHDWPGAIDGVGVAAIGSTTADALVASGVERRCIATAEPPSLGGLVDACVASIETMERKGS